jgi:hypothetical protein
MDERRVTTAAVVEDTTVIQERSCRAPRLAVWTLLLAVAWPAAPASAQCNPGRPPVEERKPASTETVIISKMPEHKGSVYALLKRFFCKQKGAVPGVPGSEVWSVPHGQMSRIANQLQALGMKITKLTGDWDHILSRYQGSIAREQQDLIDNAETAPATVGVHIVRAPDAVITAFAMTNETYTPSVPPELWLAKKEAPSTIVLRSTRLQTSHSSACDT